ncbi:10983_t:CDS:1, partial [Acaulospora colombiana]
MENEGAGNSPKNVVSRLVDICAQDIILNNILVNHKRKSRKFLESDQSKRKQLVPDVLVSFLKQGYLCELCRYFNSSSSPFFLPVIVECVDSSDFNLE